MSVSSVVRVRVRVVLRLRLHYIQYIDEFLTKTIVYYYFY